MKVGDVLAGKQTKKPCPECGSKVFERFPSGYFIMSSVVTQQTADGFMIRDAHKCPACGISRNTFHEVTPSGVLKTRTGDSSDKSRKKRISRT